MYIFFINKVIQTQLANEGIYLSCNKSYEDVNNFHEVIPHSYLIVHRNNKIKNIIIFNLFHPCIGDLLRFVW